MDDAQAQDSVPDEHVPTTAAPCRPPSSLSGAAPTSSAIHSPLPLTIASASPSTFTTHLSASTAAAVGGSKIMDANKTNHREIAPYETFACERLTREIALCETDPARTPSISNPPHRPLAEVLRETSRTIQFNAKWFAPAALSTLLQTALDVTSRSSSTVDLLAALALIDTIVTYSLLPTLAPPIRFIAYTYYQGSRSLRHKKLSEHAWDVAQHILLSHLGGQFADILLDIISDPDTQRSKFKLSAATGALMIITDKLLIDRDPQLPALNATHLLVGLKVADLGQNIILREQVIALLGTMLVDEDLTHQIEKDGALDPWLDVFGSSMWHGTDIDTEILDSAFDNLSTRIAKFEARHQPTLAQLFVEARRPLPATLSSQLVVPWERSLLLEEDTMWTAEYRTMLGRLTDSTFYLEELDAFIDIAVQAFFQTEDYVSRKDFVYTLETLILDSGTAAPAVDVLAKGIVKIFTYKTQKHKWEGQRNWLFPILCGIAKHSLEATKLLLRIRADEADQGYLALETTEDMNNPDTGRRMPSYSSLYGLTSLSFESWVSALIDMIVHEPKRWDVYHALLTSLAPQIRNHALWRDRYQHINAIRQALCECLSSDTFVDPPPESGQTKSNVIAYLLQILSATISYHSHLPRNDIKAAVITIINVAGSRDHTVSIHCIHALTICCYELPELMAGYMDAIINKMTRMVTQRYLALYVLEFFAGLSRFPDLQNRLRRDDFKRIFGVCHSYLQSIRSTTALERKRTPTSEQSAGLSSSTSSDDMAQYVYALAHHVITFWYMALKRDDRHGLKDYITSCLKYKDLDEKEHIEEQGMVTIDLMDRVDAEEQIDASLDHTFDENDGRIITRHRITGVLLITTKTSLRRGKTIVTIRRPSGTAQRAINSKKRHDSAMTDDIESRFTASVTVESDEQDYISVFPDDITGRTYGKVAIPRPSSTLGSLDIIELPEIEAITRAIKQFDRTSALDSHKAGIIYVGEEQTTEREILRNVSGSPDYREFLEDMGTLRKLKGATFNTQGLDRQDDLDGAYTIVWNNDVTELVYHITTFMPNDPNDDQMAVINKKRHIGNDYVNIVFNNSGLDFRFDTFPSAFNYVYVVISPSERTTFLQAREITAAKRKKDRFYNVHCLTRPGYPNLSSASEVKVISGASLGGYVRNLCLNACVFSAMWQAGDEAGEYPSSWRQRLQMIRRLYGQYKAKWA